MQPRCSKSGVAGLVLMCALGVQADVSDADYAAAMRRQFEQIKSNAADISNGGKAPAVDFTPAPVPAAPVKFLEIKGSKVGEHEEPNKPTQLPDWMKGNQKGLAEGKAFGETLRKDVPRQVAEQSKDADVALGGSGSNAVAEAAFAMEGEQRDREMYDGAKTIVFVSLSIPQGVLRELFKQGNQRPDVMFLFRGWDAGPDALQKFIAKLAPNLPPQDKLEHLNIAVDPVLFEEYGITHTPTFLSKRASDNTWWRVAGDIGIELAEYYVARGQAGSGSGAPVYGSQWKVIEPDLIAEMERMAGEIDWDKQTDEMWEKAQKMELSHPLMTSVEDQVYWVDVSITMQEDIRLPDGRVVIPKGAYANPLAGKDLGEVYIVFDPDVPSQIEQARIWADQYKNKDVVLFATRMKPMEADNPDHVWRKMDREVYPLNALVADRLQIKNTPSLVVQDGELLKVTVAKSQPNRIQPNKRVSP